jgi:hypothetical protein
MATNMQHIPPKQFFTNMKADKLIKVPSCDLHNKGQSWEESYLHFIITSNLGGASIVPANVKKAIKNMKYASNNDNTENIPLPQPIGDKVRIELPGFSGWGHEYDIDFNRVNKALEFIFRGLWWNEQKERFTGTLYIFGFKMIDYSYTNNDGNDWLDVNIPNNVDWNDNGTDIFKYFCFRNIEDYNIEFIETTFIVKKDWICFKFILQGFSAFAFYDIEGKDDTIFVRS